MAIRKSDTLFSVPADGDGDGLRAAAVLDGRFELQEVLGSGGMATVYRAWDREGGRPCAVKVLAENLARDEEFRHRFRQEAKAASALLHRRIVRVYGHGDAGSRPYIAMELVEGGTLRDLLHGRERLSEAAALRIAAEIADALAYAHERRVVHRDVKPHNILLTSDRHVKVADFGIARSLDETSATRTGTVFGSTQYISPEQAAGAPATEASDQYSLGVVLYEALAGRLPFEAAESPVAMALKHLHEPPYDLQWIRPDLSDATVKLVRRLLAKSPEDRFASTADLAASLRRIYARLGREDAPTGVLPIRAAAEAAAPAGSPAVRRPEGAAVGIGTELAAVLARGATVRLASVGRPAARMSDTARRPAMRGSSRYRRSSALPQAVVLSIVLAAGMIGLWFFAAAAYHGYKSAASHAPAGPVAPSLVGQTLTVAQNIAASSHFALVVANGQAANVPPGVIASQDPPPGGAVTKTRTIHVVVSQGSGIVPDMRGASPENGKQQLTAAGLRLGRIMYATDAKAAAGMVASQSANPGDHLASGTPVNIVVSRGPGQASPLPAAPAQQTAPASAPIAPGTVPASYPGRAIVPNVIGASLVQAQEQLRGAGLQAGHVTYVSDGSVPAGVVVRQQRAAGTQAAANDTVDLVVSQGPPPVQTPAPSPPPTPSQAPSVPMPSQPDQSPAPTTP